jgi:acetolactate synthase-1/2/3 large subunit
VRVQEEAKYGRKSGVELPLYDTVEYAAAIGATGLMIRTADEIAPVFQEGI